jgi:hypothetical protein
MHPFPGEMSISIMDNCSVHHIQEVTDLLEAAGLIFLPPYSPDYNPCEELLHQLQEVLERLKGTGLKLKPSKCHLLQKSVKYLGHVISEHGVETDPEKTASVAKWCTPTNIKELWQFLGLASYYQRLSEISHRLQHLCFS